MNGPHFHFITLFPDAVEVWLTTSILGKAHAAGLFSFSLHQLRDFSNDKHRSVDDVAYGGGGGMVLKVEPLVAAVEHVLARHGKENCRTFYFSPGGKRVDQDLIDHIHARIHTGESPSHLIFICGHYEGVDQRFLDHWVDEEVSLGDFVLTGGELPAVALADALIRKLDGALGETGAHRQESFSLQAPQTGHRLLEYPHYTRPADFKGFKVPDVLLSGDHGKVAKWREQQSLSRTEARRPDLLGE